MKNLVILAILLGSFSLSAQPKNAHQFNPDKQAKELLKDLSPQQRAVILSKKMVLQLDLSDKQQEQVADLILEREANRLEDRPGRKEMETLSSEERFRLINKKLDDRIQFKRELKAVLTEAQWTKWNESLELKNRGRKAIHHTMKR